MSFGKPSCHKHLCSSQFSVLYSGPHSCLIKINFSEYLIILFLAGERTFQTSPLLVHHFPVVIGLHFISEFLLFLIYFHNSFLVPFMFGLISLCNHSLIFPDVCVPLFGALLSQFASVLYVFWSLLKHSCRAPHPGLTLGVSPSLADAAEPSRDPAGFLPQRPRSLCPAGGRVRAQACICNGFFALVLPESVFPVCALRMDGGTKLA